MNCPHCHKPIDHKLLRQAVNKEIAAGKGSRPGAKGLVRNPKGRPVRKSLGNLPPVEELMGAVPNLTSGMSLKEYLEDDPD